MSGMTYFRIGVPNDMVADVMWNDDFEVSIESYSKHETNYQRHFGTPEKVTNFLEGVCECVEDYCGACSICPVWDMNRHCCGSYTQTLEWLEGEAE